MTSHAVAVAARHQQDPHAHARAAVKANREIQRWSIRQAAAGSGVSNQTWADFESAVTTNLTNNIYFAVKRRFRWPDDWPENPPPPTVLAPAEAGSLDVRVSRLEVGQATLRRLLTTMVETLIEDEQLRHDLLDQLANGDEQPSGASRRSSR